MRILVIGHPEAVLGFSLVGVGGQAAQSAADVDRALDAALSAKDIGIVLVTRDAARLTASRMEQLKLRNDVPLVIEIPSPEGAPTDQASLRELVQRAIGIQV
jgi:V/A-type H+-transporting ATPase subunit F